MDGLALLLAKATFPTYTQDPIPHIYSDIVLAILPSGLKHHVPALYWVCPMGIRTWPHL